MKKVPELLKDHYSKTFAIHGASSKGVDWKSPEVAKKRHELLLNLLEDNLTPNSLLDVGCGYGALLDLLLERKMNIAYTGVDFVPAMIEEAQKRNTKADFFAGDFLEWKTDKTFEYVIANGLFTQKFSASDEEMEEFIKNVTKKMFALCTKGIAFNLLTDRVDFRSQENYYRSPEKTLSESLLMSRKCKINHASPFFEYFVYIYK